MACCVGRTMEAIHPLAGANSVCSVKVLVTREVGHTVASGLDAPSCSPLVVRVIRSCRSLEMKSDPVKQCERSPSGDSKIVLSMNGNDSTGCGKIPVRLIKAI